MARAQRMARPPMAGKPAITFWHGSVDDCLALVERAFVEGGRHARSVRHYYYQLANAGLLKTWPKRYKTSADNAYDWVSRLLVNARENGRLGWNVVTDDGRRASSYYHSEPLREYIEGIGDSYYTVNIWRGQASRVEIWTEKDGLYDVLNAVARRYGVVVNVSKGYSSASIKHDAAVKYRERLKEEEQTTTLLYVGDLDPSGVDIERDLYETMRRYGYRGTPPVRVALKPEHVAGLPIEARQDLKSGDSRTPKFKLDYPQLDYGYQIEALPGRRLNELVELAIQAHMDIDAFNEAVRLTLAVREWLTERVQEALLGYQEGMQQALDAAILQEGELIDEETGYPFPAEVVRTYLAEEVAS
jgi:hypothetical protein